MVWKNGEEKKVSFGSLLFAIPISSKRLSRCLDFDAASLSLSLSPARRGWREGRERSRRSRREEEEEEVEKSFFFLFRAPPERETSRPMLSPRSLSSPSPSAPLCAPRGGPSSCTWLCTSERDPLSGRKIPEEAPRKLARGRLEAPDREPPPSLFAFSPSLFLSSLFASASKKERERRSNQ